MSAPAVPASSVCAVTPDHADTARHPWLPQTRPTAPRRPNDP